MKRRQYRRVRLRLPVRLRWAAPLGQKTERCETRNASRGGLLVTCHEQHGVGMPVWVTFPFDPVLPDLQPEILARVLRSEEREENGQRVSVVAVHFESSLRASIPGNDAGKDSPKPESEWRSFSTPIRVRLQHVPWFEEAMTSEVSSEELRFVSNREYSPGDSLLVSFAALDSSPWLGEGEHSARVLRVDPIPGSNSLSVTVRKAPS
jgi:PilZ domain